MDDIALQIAALSKANKNSSRIVIITQGVDDVVLAQGILVLNAFLLCSVVPYHHFFFIDGKVTKYPVISLPSEKIVDTNGAGDAFVGGMVLHI